MIRKRHQAASKLYRGRTAWNREEQVAVDGVGYIFDRVEMQVDDARTPSAVLGILSPFLKRHQDEPVHLFVYREDVPEQYSVL